VLARSSFLQQRVVALQILARIVGQVNNLDVSNKGQQDLQNVINILLFIYDY
jgi:alpha-D-ribose 1-methylphosphonate 5-phosphate C-P lyase